MFVRIVLVLAVLLLFAGAAHAEILSPQAFTEAFAKAAQAAVPGAKVAITGELETETHYGNGETMTSDLHNAYSVYRQAPGQLDDVLRRYVGVLAESINGAGPVDRTRIVPVMKSQAWLSGLREQRKAQQLEATPEPLTESYNSELIIAYAQDQPTSIRYLTTRDDIGGLDRVALLVLALRNLHRLLPKIEMRDGPDGTFMIEAGGDYEASLLLADPIWSGGQVHVDGDIVAAVPAKDALFVTGSHNRTGLKKLRAIAAEVAARPYGLSSALFVYRDGKFKVFGRN
jgi:uncharacterized protein YtpQ (UPF0354 family)